MEAHLQYPALAHLLAVYYGQDADLDYDLPQGAFDCYVKETGIDKVEMAYKELCAILPIATEEEAVWTIDRLGCGWDYSKHFGSALGWLDDLRGRLRQVLERGNRA